MSENLDLEPVGKFRRRVVGGVHQDSPLDGLEYCNADLNEIGTDQHGFPNRVAVAAFTQRPEFLTLHGAADPTVWANKLRDSLWGKAFSRQQG